MLALGFDEAPGIVLELFAGAIHQRVNGNAPLAQLIGAAMALGAAASWPASCAARVERGAGHGGGLRRRVPVGGAHIDEFVAGVYLTPAG